MILYVNLINRSQIIFALSLFTLKLESEEREEKIY